MLFRTVSELMAGGLSPAATGAMAAKGDGVRAAAATLLASLPVPFDMLAIEADVPDKTPLVVVALQVHRTCDDQDNERHRTQHRKRRG